MTFSSRPPLEGLALFMICLAVIGGAGAAAHYYLVDIPYQQNAALPAPDNSAVIATKCANCRLTCSYDPQPVTCEILNCDLLC